MAQGMITPYREDRAIRCAYELGVGSEAFITSKSESTTHLQDGQKVIIPPGQFGLLTTTETIYVPSTAIAFISIRARVKFQGLVNVSGFHVDPGFRGKLKFAVYNAGSKEIIVDQDERVFMIWFADLDAISPDPYPAQKQQSSVITSEDVSRIQGTVASPAQLQKNIDELRIELEKKIHAVEHNSQLNRTLVILFITICCTLVSIVFVKPLLESVTSPANPVSPKIENVSTGVSSEPPKTGKGK